MQVNFADLQRQVTTLNHQHRYGDSEILLRPLVASGTAPLIVWRLLLTAIRPLGRIEETCRIQEMLVEMEPGNLTTRFELAETLLLLGDFERGWREYRYRYSMGHTTRIERKVQRPRWDGAPLGGKRLLVHDEQGYGDTFQFLRMVPWAHARCGGSLILQINDEQLPLARRAGGYDAIVSRNALPPAFDVHCEMMSLPMAMGLRLTDLPGKIPYLTCDAERLAHWRRRLANIPQPRVAVVWAGRPTHFNDAARSMSLADLRPLGQTGVNFLSVQKGPKAAEARTPPPGMNIVALGEEINDFEDTAAILQLADLLISVDSSPVHLAGALGRPVWVMLPFVPDWRWLQHRTDTPWYPNMRLFRQQHAYRWEDVIAAMAAELKQLRFIDAPVRD